MSLAPSCSLRWCGIGRGAGNGAAASLCATREGDDLLAELPESGLAPVCFRGLSTAHHLCRQGSAVRWRITCNYFYDLRSDFFFTIRAFQAFLEQNPNPTDELHDYTY
jgi:hypothetical protein